jgi:hypothetical protein
MSSDKRLPDNLSGLSDLFFNYEHPHFDGRRIVRDGKEGEGRTYEDERASLVLDAEDFLKTFYLAVEPIRDVECMFDVTAEQLADDFLARL